MARTSQKTAVRIYEILKQHLHQDKDGLWHYDEDWSDARVAEELNESEKGLGLKESIVASTRYRLMGPISRRKVLEVRSDPGLEDLSKLVLLLHRKLNALAAWLDLPDWPSDPEGAQSDPEASPSASQGPLGQVPAEPPDAAAERGSLVALPQRRLRR